MHWLLLAILIVPALEIGIFIWAGGIIGPWWVVALIVLTGIFGVAIAKQEGLAAWKRARQMMYYGEVPTELLLDGICIFAGGVLLFVPGFLTDIIGFILVLPWTRKMVKAFLQKQIRRKLDHSTITFRRW